MTDYDLAAELIIKLLSHLGPQYHLRPITSGRPLQNAAVVVASSDSAQISSARYQQQSLDGNPPGYGNGPSHLRVLADGLIVLPTNIIGGGPNMKY